MRSREAVKPRQSARDKRIARLIDRIRRSQARFEARAARRERSQARAAAPPRTKDDIGARTDRTIEEIKELIRQMKKQFARNKVLFDRNLSSAKNDLAEVRAISRDRRRTRARNGH